MLTLVVIACSNPGVAVHRDLCTDHGRDLWVVVMVFFYHMGPGMGRSEVVAEDNGSKGHSMGLRKDRDGVGVVVGTDLFLLHRDLLYH